MEIQPGQPARPAEWFTGDVWIDDLVTCEEPSRVRVSVAYRTHTAEAGRRSARSGGDQLPHRMADVAVQVVPDQDDGTIELLVRGV